MFLMITTLVLRYNKSVILFISSYPLIFSPRNNIRDEGNARSSS